MWICKTTKIVEQNVPLGFDSEINATNIQITISKQKINIINNDH